MQYRHIIDWLVRKPGAFENYRCRDDLFSCSRFASPTTSSNDDTPFAGLPHSPTSSKVAITSGSSGSRSSTGGRSPLRTSAARVGASLNWVMPSCYAVGVSSQFVHQV